MRGLMPVPCALDVDLVWAIVMTESGGDPWAMRYEPRYRYLVNARTRQPFRTLSPEERVSATAPADFLPPAGVSADTEWTAQRTSWGLMQVMGAVARELGHKGPLSALCSPAVGVTLGCRVLAGHLAWAGGDVFRAVRAYNGGRGGADSPATEPYLQKVMAHLGRVR